jgi:hypothetical protein
MFIPGRVILPDSSPDQTSTYSALHDLTRPNYLTRSFLDQISAYPIIPGHLTQLPYPILSRSDFYLPDRIRSPYPTFLPGQVTLRCTFRRVVLHREIFYGVTHAPCFLRNLYVKARNIRPQPCKRFSQNHSFMLTPNDYP